MENKHNSSDDKYSYETSSSKTSISTPPSFSESPPPFIQPPALLAPPPNQLPSLTDSPPHPLLTLAPFQPPAPMSMSSSAENRSAGSSSHGGQPDTWKCKLCSKEVQTELAFHKHLTSEHYKDKIVRRVGYPFKCLSCNYQSPGHLDNNEKTQDLLMHYGVIEKFSIKLYNQEISRLVEKEEIPVNQQLYNQNKADKHPRSAASYLVCRICNLSMDSQVLLLKHLTLEHFAKAMYDELPTDLPFICPHNGCDEAKSNSHKLLLHYGIYHKRSLTLYRKHPSYLNYERSSCSKDSGVPKVELPENVSSKTNKLKAVVSPYNPLSEKEKESGPSRSTGEGASSPASHRSSSPSITSPSSISSLSSVLLSPEPTMMSPSVPADRRTHSSTNQPSAERTSSSSERASSVVRSSSSSKERSSSSGRSSSSSKRSSTTGRSSSSNERSSGSTDRSSSSNERSSSSNERTSSSTGRSSSSSGRSSSDSSSKRLKIEYLERRIKNLESQQKEKLKEKEEEFERKLNVKDSDLNEEKVKARLLEEKLTDKESRITDLTTENDMVHESLSRVEETFATKSKQYTDLLTAKEACDRIIEEKETERINSYEELYQKEKELESAMNTIKSLKKQLSSDDKNKDPEIQELTELKTKNEKLEQKLEEVQKDISAKEDKLKVTQGLNDEMNAEMVLLKSERKNLNKSISDLTNAYEKEIEDLKEKLKAKNKPNTDKSVVKALEKDKKEMGKKVKLLETTLSQWENRQFTNVKLISGLEKERDSLQLKLKEMKDGNLSHEDQLYWKDVAIKNANKETKALQGKYDELNTSLEEALKQASEAKVDAEKYKVKATELEKSQTKFDNKKVDNLSKTLDLQREEIEHLKETLRTKDNRLAEFNSSTKKLKAENKKLQSSKERFEAERLDAALKMEQSEEQFVSLEAQCANLDSQVKEQNIELDDLRGQLELSKEQLELYKEQLEMIPDQHQRSSRRKGVKRGEQRVEMLMMNQVLKDMDTVIKLREEGMSPEQEFSTSIIQEESFEGTSCTDSMASPLTVDTEDINQYPTSENSFQLSSPQTMVITPLEEELITKASKKQKNARGKRKISSPKKGKKKRRKSTNAKDKEIYSEDDDSEEIIDDSIDDIDASVQDDLPLNARAASASRKRGAARQAGIKIETNSPTDKKGANTEQSTKKGGSNSTKKPLNSLVDVTAEYETEEGAGDYVCGVCCAWEPPEDLAALLSGKKAQTTEWIGCDCDRWFHKQCTGLKKFSTKFSCKSLKMDCLVIPITLDSVTTW